MLMNKHSSAWKYILVCFLPIILASCARAPLSRIEEAMRPITKHIELSDSLSPGSFFVSLKKHIETMKISNQVKDPMIFGTKKISKKKYINSLEDILLHENDWINFINLNFDLLEVYGHKNYGEVMTTGYYEPIVLGSHEKTNQFSEAIYATPNDLVTIDLNKFNKGQKLGTVKGRLVGKRIIPYFERKEMKLNNLGLEIAWVEPIDAFFIQIQGSGTVQFPDGENIRIGYAEQNGHPYEPIGKFLTDVIPIEKMSMQKIKAHLKTLNHEEQNIIFNKNPSFVFFKKITSDALTFAGMEVSAGRTIATDNTYFPKGALAFLDINEPVFNDINDLEPTSIIHRPRFVFDQDTGGAIKGGGHIDLYMGQGDLAAQKAGVMKDNSLLYYLIPKGINNTSE